MNQEHNEQIQLLETKKDLFYAYLEGRKTSTTRQGSFSNVGTYSKRGHAKSTLFVPTDMTLYNDPGKVAVKTTLARVYFPNPDDGDKWSKHVRWGVKGPGFVISNLQLNRGIRMYMFYHLPRNKGILRRDVTHRPLELSRLLQEMLKEDTHAYSSIQDEFGLHYRAERILNELMPKKLEEWGYDAPDFYPSENLKQNSWWGYSYYSRVYPILGQLFEYGLTEKINETIEKSRKDPRVIYGVSTSSALRTRRLHDADLVDENYHATRMFYSEDLMRVGRYLRKANLKELCVTLFGKKKATKPVVKAVGKVLTDTPTDNWNLLIVASRLKYFFEPDQLAEFITHGLRLGSAVLDAWSFAPSRKGMTDLDVVREPERYHINEFKSLIAGYTPQRILQMLKTPDETWHDDPDSHRGDPWRPWTHMSQEVLDTARMYSQIKEYEANQDEIHAVLREAGVENIEDFAFRRIEKPKTFHELHTALTVQASLVKEIPRVIKQEPYRGVDGCVTWNGFRIETPKVSTQLKLWGSELNHCIGTYTNTAVAGAGLYLAVRDASDALVANIELTPVRSSEGWHISQFLGRHNGHPSLQVVAPVMEVLFEQELLTYGDAQNLRFWGSPFTNSHRLHGERVELTPMERRSVTKVVGIAHRVKLEGEETLDSQEWLDRVENTVVDDQPALRNNQGGLDADGFEEPF